MAWCKKFIDGIRSINFAGSSAALIREALIAFACEELIKDQEKTNKELEALPASIPDNVKANEQLRLYKEKQKQKLKQITDQLERIKSMLVPSPFTANIGKELRTTNPSPALRAPSPRFRGEGKNEGSSLGGKESTALEKKIAIDEEFIRNFAANFRNIRHLADTLSDAPPVIKSQQTRLYTEVLFKLEQSEQEAQLKTLSLATLQNMIEQGLSLYDGTSVNEALRIQYRKLVQMSAYELVRRHCEKITKSQSSGPQYREYKNFIISLMAKLPNVGKSTIFDDLSEYRNTEGKTIEALLHEVDEKHNITQFDAWENNAIKEALVMRRIFFHKLRYGQEARREYVQKAQKNLARDLFFARDLRDMELFTKSTDQVFTSLAEKRALKDDRQFKLMRDDEEPYEVKYRSKGDEQPNRTLAKQKLETALATVKVLCGTGSSERLPTDDQSNKIEGDSEALRSIEHGLFAEFARPIVELSTTGKISVSLFAFDEKIAAKQLLDHIKSKGGFERSPDTMLEGSDNISQKISCHTFTGNSLAEIEKQITTAEFSENLLTAYKAGLTKIKRAVRKQELTKISQLELDNANELLLRKLLELRSIYPMPGVTFPPELEQALTDIDQGRFEAALTIEGLEGEINKLYHQLAKINKDNVSESAKPIIEKAKVLARSSRERQNKLACLTKAFAEDTKDKANSIADIFVKEFADISDCKPEDINHECCHEIGVMAEEMGSLIECTKSGEPVLQEEEQYHYFFAIQRIAQAIAPTKLTDVCFKIPVAADKQLTVEVITNSGEEKKVIVDLKGRKLPYSLIKLPGKEEFIFSYGGSAGLIARFAGKDDAGEAVGQYGPDQKVESLLTGLNKMVKKRYVPASEPTGTPQQYQILIPWAEGETFADRANKHLNRYNKGEIAYHDPSVRSGEPLQNLKDMVGLSQALVNEVQVCASNHSAHDFKPDKFLYKQNPDKSYEVKYINWATDGVSSSLPSISPQDRELTSTDSSEDTQLQTSASFMDEWALAMIFGICNRKTYFSLAKEREVDDYIVPGILEAGQDGLGLKVVSTEKFNEFFACGSLLASNENSDNDEDESIDSDQDESIENDQIYRQQDAVMYIPANQDEGEPLHLFRLLLKLHKTITAQNVNANSRRQRIADDIQQILTTVFRAVSNRKGLTKQQLGEQLNLAQQCIKNYEKLVDPNYQRSLETEDILQRIIDSKEFSADQLLQEGHSHTEIVGPKNLLQVESCSRLEVLCTYPTTSQQQEQAISILEKALNEEQFNDKFLTKGVPGRVLLTKCIAQGQEEILLSLLSKISKENPHFIALVKGEGLLHYAAEQGMTKVFEKLVPTLKNAGASEEDIFKLMLKEYGPGPGTDRIEGVPHIKWATNCLHIAIRNNNESQLATILALLPAGDCYDSVIYKAIHFSAELGNKSLFNKIVTKYNELNFTNPLTTEKIIGMTFPPDDRSPYHLFLRDESTHDAVAWQELGNNPELAKKFLAIPAQSVSATPTHCAAEQGNFSAVSRLIQLGKEIKLSPTEWMQFFSQNDVTPQVCHPERYTRHPERYTRHPERYTRHPERYTRHPERYTRHPERYTRHPERYTRHPERYTRHPERYTRHPERSEGSPEFDVTGELQNDVHGKNLLNHILEQGQLGYLHVFITLIKELPPAADIWVHLLSNPHPVNPLRNFLNSETTTTEQFTSVTLLLDSICSDFNKATAEQQEARIVALLVNQQWLVNKAENPLHHQQLRKLLQNTALSSPAKQMLFTKLNDSAAQGTNAKEFYSQLVAEVSSSNTVAQAQVAQIDLSNVAQEVVRQSQDINELIYAIKEKAENAEQGRSLRTQVDELTKKQEEINRQHQEKVKALEEQVAKQRKEIEQSQETAKLAQEQLNAAQTDNRKLVDQLGQSERIGERVIWAS